MRNVHFCLLFILMFFVACKKSDNGTNPSSPAAPKSFSFSSLKVNDAYNGFDYTNVNFFPVIKLSFSDAIDHNSVVSNVAFKNKNGSAIGYIASYQNNDSTIVIQPSSPLKAITKYTVDVLTSLQSQKGGKLLSALSVSLVTQIDSTDKFPIISDNELLDKVQQQTFKYFWDFAHPVSGLARERNTSGDIVTSGGSGFGLMAIVTGIHRNFITRSDGLARMQKIVSFLKNTAQKFHGAFPHWLNGATGAVVPFSAKDDGADIVETSYLVQGLLTARQFFDDPGVEETALRTDINAICNAVEWSWFRKNNENVLYWHWSPDYGWDMNMPIKGWNECVITYILAASSPAFSIPKIVYDNGWAGNGSIRTNNLYYGLQLPLGPPFGGPLFFEHYSFLGINPKPDKPEPNR